MYLAFFFLICAHYGLPLHIMRDLYLTIRSFRSRVADFLHYRRLTHNMHDRFPDATESELDHADRVCIICREHIFSGKKLACGHIFHFHCLRSWLERQQTCPTCRAPIEAPQAATVQAASAADFAEADLAAPPNQNVNINCHGTTPMQPLPGGQLGGPVHAAAAASAAMAQLSSADMSAWGEFSMAGGILNGAVPNMEFEAAASSAAMTGAQQETLPPGATFAGLGSHSGGTGGPLAAMVPKPPISGLLTGNAGGSGWMNPKGLRTGGAAIHGAMGACGRSFFRAPQHLPLPVQAHVAVSTDDFVQLQIDWLQRQLGIVQKPCVS